MFYSSNVARMMLLCKKDNDAKEIKKNFCDFVLFCG